MRRTTPDKCCGSFWYVLCILGTVSVLAHLKTPASGGLTITIPIATDMNATSPIIRLFTLGLALPRAATQMLSSALGMTYIASSPRLRSASTKSDRPEQNPAIQ